VGDEGWRRPSEDEPVETIPVVEVPLAGPDGPEPEAIGHPTTGRRTTGVAAMVGLVVGLVLGVVGTILWSDDEPSSVAPTTTEDDPATITVPPTLPPITEPPTPQELFADTVVTLPSLDVDMATISAGYELSDDSLAALDETRPRRSVTEYEVGAGGFEQTVTITNDPTTGRYLLEFDFGGPAQRVVIDIEGGTTYVSDPGGIWSAIPNDEVIAGTGFEDMATFVRRLQLGPIRSDTRDAWRFVRANTLVETAAGTDALREHVVVLDAAAVPEWARYAFGPAGEAPPIADGGLVGFAVYVTATGEIRQVIGSGAYGATTQRIVHRIEALAEPPTIDLPAVEEIAPPSVPPGSTPDA
jgi:hypothetical protein